MWGQLSHAEDWLLFPENLGPYLSIDETSLSNGELYTIITNREAHGGKGAIVAIVKGTKADDVIAVVEQIPEEALQGVKEVTLDLSESMDCSQVLHLSYPGDRPLSHSKAGV